MVKYVDDTTLSETFQSKSYQSNMMAFLNNVLAWSLRNDMELNTTKTKEMILGPINKIELPRLTAYYTDRHHRKS